MKRKTINDYKRYKSYQQLATPIYQIFLSDSDFWRSVQSLQLDETIAIYVAKLLNAPEGLFLVNNKHPMVVPATLTAGYRLVLHGLSAEMLHKILRDKKRQQEQGVQERVL